MKNPDHVRALVDRAETLSVIADTNRMLDELDPMIRSHQRARCCTLMLPSMGDLTLAWDPAQDEAMLALIRAKMAEGVTFFILEPRLGGLVGPARTPLSDAQEALQRRAVSIGDEHVTAVLNAGAAVVVPAPNRPMRSTRRAKTAEEAVSSETLAVPQRRGG